MVPIGSKKRSADIPVIGLIGGVASGKSAVAKGFERLNCAILDGDALGHQVLDEPAVVEAAKRRWGESVIKDGQLQRQAIATRVFSPQPENRTELEFWESITHPRIGDLLKQEIKKIRAAGQHAGIVLDAAVLLKAGWEKECDFIVFVDAPPAVRLNRALSRGWSASQLREREAAQLSIEEKRRQSDFVIDNSGDLDQTYEQVHEVWHGLSR